MALSLVVFVGLIVMINFMIQDIQAKPFIILGIIMAACVGLYAIVGIPVVAGLVGTGAGVMLAIGGSLLLFALGIVAINKVLESNINPENFKGLVTVMWQLAKIYGIAAMLLLPVTLGAPTLILLGTSLTVFSIGLALVNRIVQNINPTNFENLGDCITTLIDSFKELKLNPIDMITIGAKIKYLRSIIGDVGTIANIVGDVAKMQIPIKWNDKGFVTEYRQLTNADFELAAKNISVILTGMLDAIGNLEMSGELARKALIAKNVFANLSESITPVSSMVDCIQKIATMQIPDKWDKNGNAISYHTITPDELLAAKDSVKDILTTIVTAITSKDVMNLIDNYGKRHAKKLTKFFEAASHVGAMADVVVKLAQGNFVMEMDSETGKPKKYGNFNQLLGSNGATTITQNITAIISSMIGGLNGALAAYKPKDLDDISDKINTISNLSAPIGSAVDAIIKILENEALQKFDSVKSKEKVEGIFSALVSPFTNPNINANDAMNVANSVEKTTSATSNFLNTLNSVDKGKLDTMREISRNLYEFSKSINGNFDALADALSEKLVKVLEDLNITLDKTGGKLDGLNDAIGSSSNTQESMTADLQKNGKEQKDNKKDKNNDNLIKKLTEISNQLKKGIVAKSEITNIPEVKIKKI